MPGRPGPTVEVAAHRAAADDDAAHGRRNPSAAIPAPSAIDAARAVGRQSSGPAIAEPSAPARRPSRQRGGRRRRRGALRARCRAAAAPRRAAGRPTAAGRHRRGRVAAAGSTGAATASIVRTGGQAGRSGQVGTRGRAAGTVRDGRHAGGSARTVAAIACEVDSGGFGRRGRALGEHPRHRCRRRDGQSARRPRRCRARRWSRLRRASRLGRRGAPTAVAACGPARRRATGGSRVGTGGAGSTAAARLRRDRLGRVLGARRERTRRHSRRRRRARRTPGRSTGRGPAARRIPGRRPSSSPSITSRASPTLRGRVLQAATSVARGPIPRTVVRGCPECPGPSTRTGRSMRRRPSAAATCSNVCERADADRPAEDERRHQIATKARSDGDIRSGRRPVGQRDDGPRTRRRRRRRAARQDRPRGRVATSHGTSVDSGRRTTSRTAASERPAGRRPSRTIRRAARPPTISPSTHATTISASSPTAPPATRERRAASRRRRAASARRT